MVFIKLVILLSFSFVTGGFINFNYLQFTGAYSISSR